MNAFVDDGEAGIRYVWCSHNNLANQCGMEPSEKLDIENLPPDAEVFWVDIEKDDGTDGNIADLLVKGE